MGPVSSPSWIIKGSGRYDSFQSRNEKRNLNAVTAPTVVGFLHRQILVTEWVEGTRLDQSDADDVPRPCSVALMPI
jgi:hypothetical protein